MSTATVQSAEPLHWLAADEEWIWGRALALTAAFLAGLASAAAALATEHAKTRVQFGKPIGVHQAIKHACVDMEIGAQAAQAQTFSRRSRWNPAGADAVRQLLSAMAVAGSAAVDNAAAGIHVFGGMGYTFENDMHLYLKRAHVFRTPGDRTRRGAGRAAGPGPRAVSGTVAIAGVALSDVGRVDDKGPYELIAQASRRALADAGLTPADVDGLASTGQGTLPPVDVGEYLGLRPRWMDSTAVGGASWEVMASHAADAIAAGHADVVLLTYGSTATGRPPERACAAPTSTGARAARCSGRRPTAIP